MSSFDETLQFGPALDETPASASRSAPDGQGPGCPQNRRRVPPPPPRLALQTSKHPAEPVRGHAAPLA